MKPTYGGYEGKKRGNFSQLPPVGQYIAQIMAVRTEKAYSGDRDDIVMMIEITEGEYKDQYHKVFEEQKERFGSDAKYKGVFKLHPFIESDEPWVKQRFESNLFCVQESNPGYTWDWDENKLKNKKIGINVRENIYTGKDGKEHTTTEIGQFETIDDVRNGKCKNMKPRGKKKEEGESSDAGGFQGIEYGTDATGAVEVPF